MTIDPVRLTAPAIAYAVRRRSLDPVTVIEAFLDQIRQRNSTINALVDHDEAAPLAEAAGVRDRLGAGEILPLAGVPVVVKDSIWVGGRRITQGSRLYRDFVAPRDALPVARLRQAGVVIIGIGNMPEFGAKEVTDNVIYGRTFNPRDLSRTPGGSSGGCAAALAADMAPIAIGGDGGGSCRRPPAHVGVVGFKPSPGIVADPFGFPGALAGIACTCPMGRVVADVAAAFEVMAGPHAEDVLSVTCPSASAQPVPALRFAYSPLLGLDLALDSDVQEVIDTAVATLRRAGLQIAGADPVWPDGTEEARILAIEDSGLAHLFGARFLADPGSSTRRSATRSSAAYARPPRTLLPRMGSV